MKERHRSNIKDILKGFKCDKKKLCSQNIQHFGVKAEMEHVYFNDYFLNMIVLLPWV